MSAEDRFEQRLPSRLEGLAAPRTPSYFDDVISTTARTRQRPGWSFPERWIHMSTMTDRLATAPRAPLRLIAVAGLLVLALAALVLVAGASRQPKVPAPFGVAANGRVAWVDGSGAIVAASQTDTKPSVLVPGPGNDRPLFSPDGTRLAYVRQASSGHELVVAAADGSDPLVLASGLGTIGLVWAPDSRSMVIAQGGTLSRVEARAGGTPVVIATGVKGSYDWNVEPTMLFRPPDGREIAYLRGATGGASITVAKADGSSPREILTPDGGLAYTDLGGLQWSPDGTRLAMTVTLDASGADTAVYVVNADGSGLHRASDRTLPGKLIREANPAWSPDGESLAMQVWVADAQSGEQETRPLTIVDVANGDAREIGSESVNGFNGWAWSPDGASLIVVPGTGRIATIDVATGKPRSDAWQSASGATWQRVAP